MVPVPVPHGFRFNPTDEELIQVLDRKVSGQEMPLHFILIDFGLENKMQDLEWNHTQAVSNKERYYYCKKEINHSREVNGRGWWKATSHVKKIYANDQLVGYKRPLTFHRFKSKDRNRNNAVKTNWIMHEYSLESRATEWRLCKIKYKGKPSIQEEMENLRQNHSPRNDVEATAGSSTTTSLMSTELDSGSEQQREEDPVLPTLMPIDDDDGHQQPYCQWNMQEAIIPAELASCDPYDLLPFNTNAAGYHFQQQEQVEAIDQQAFPSLWSWQS